MIKFYIVGTINKKLGHRPARERLFTHTWNWDVNEEGVHFRSIISILKSRVTSLNRMEVC